jgi:hypothetical protein
LRIQYGEAVSLVMSRRDRHKDIYRDDVDRRDLLKTRAEEG